MATHARFLGLAAFAAIASLCLAQGQGASSGASQSAKLSPADFLQRGFERRRSVPAVIIYWLGAQSVLGEKIMIKSESDGKGSTRMSVLQPLRRQGSVTIDNGRNILVFNTEAKWFQSLASARPHALQASDRVRLINQNYRLSYGRNSNFIGRNVREVVAKPKNRGGATIRITCDLDHGLILRNQSQLGRETMTPYEAISVEFPDSLPSSLFSFTPPEGYDTARAPRISRSTEPRSIARNVGFKNSVSGEYPLGFVLEFVDGYETTPSPMMIYRLTDGLQTVNVFVWRKGAKMEPFKLSPQDTRESKDFVFAAAGDAPLGIRTRLLDYVRAEIDTNAQAGN